MSRQTLKQSVSYVGFFTGVGAAAIVTWVVWMLADVPMTYLGDNAQLSVVRQNTQWTEILLNYLPVLFFVVAMLGSIALVVYRTRFA